MTNLRELLEGKYEILGQLDDTGTGEVYKVRHLFLDEVRLVRVVRPEAALEREASARQLDEARAAMRLRHPHVAQLHDFSLDDEGNAFVVLESIEGLPLDAAVRELGIPPVGLTLEIAQQALRALGYLHRSGRILRHVTPERLTLTRDVDGRPLVKWTDLGISRLLGAEEDVPLGGLFPANPRWAAPEQFGGSGREPDARSDLYVFGLLLYELLTGRFPIAGHDPFSYMAGHLSKPPLDFAESDPEGNLTAELREAVLQTLAKDPAQRPASAEELARRLVTIQDRFPDQGDYVERALGEASKRAATLRPVVLPPKPEPPPAPEPSPAPPPVALVTEPAPSLKPPEPPVADDLPLRGAGPARQLEWDRPRMEYGTQRVPVAPPAPKSDPPAPKPDPPAPPMAPPVEAPIPAAEPAGSRKRGIAIIAAVAVVALVGGAIGAFLGRGSSSPAASPEATNPGTPSAGASSSTLPEGAPPALVVPPVVEIEQKPAPPPPPDNETAVAPLSRKERQELARLEAERRRLEALRAMPPPGRGSEGPVAKAPVGPMQRGDLITPGPGVTGVEYPEPVTDIAAAYPAAAVESRRAAKVRVSVLVDENGNVVQSRVREGDSSGLGFNEAALAAARRVRFLPATRDGVPGKCWTELMFEFDPPPAPPVPAPPSASEAPPAATPPPAAVQSGGNR